MKEIIKSLPDTPGVYQYFGSKGELLYVGKAKSLKNRVKSYWRFTPELHPNPSQDPRILKMLTEAVIIEYIVVETEEDSLILENSIIKKQKPKYNILLRDDKTYPYIYVDESQDFPRFELTRKIIEGSNITYYGPFAHGGKYLLDSIYEVYPLVQKKSCLNGKEACLFHQINKCLAPCEGKITKEDYSKIVKKVKTAIEKKKPIIQELSKKMSKLASQERYEDAADIRDKINAITNLSITSDIDLAKIVDMDIFAIENGDERGVVVKLFVRNGRIESIDHTYYRQTHIYDKDEAYKQALIEFYTQEKPNVPKIILVAEDFDDKEAVQDILSKRFNKKIQIQAAQKGQRKKLTELAVKNAKELLRSKTDDTIMEQKIAEVLDLTSIPYRIETFDNSHMMGVATVGGMVVWDNNSWDKSSYRKYNLSCTDEYAQMKEMLTRRIEDFKDSPAPDLWILDGGQANLNLANTLLKEAKVNLEVIGIAKEKIDSKAHRAKGSAKDLIYSKNGVIQFKPNDGRLHWIQRQRDEAHRYAITFHRSKKRKEDVKVSLLEEKGIGAATVKKLIDYFGTFENISKAKFEEIEKVTNKKVAKILKEKENNLKD